MKQTQEILLTVICLLQLLWQYSQCLQHEGLHLNKIFTQGENAVIECTRTNERDHTSWLDMELSRAVFNGTRYIGGEKYRNFHLKSLGSEGYNLEIKSITEADEGSYGCFVNGVISLKVNVSVEVPPLVRITQPEEQNGVIAVVDGRTTMFVCEATNATPSVFLFWMINNEVVQDDVNVTTHNVSEGRYDSYSYLSHTPSIGDESITCISSGQKVTPPVTVSAKLDVQNIPTCTVYMVQKEYDATIVCRCSGHPRVENYTIVIDNETHYQRVLNRFHGPANVSCSGTNAAGTSHSDKVNFQSGNLRENDALMLSFLLPTVVITICGVVLCGIYIRRLKAVKKGPFLRVQKTKKKKKSTVVHTYDGEPEIFNPEKGVNVPLATLKDDFQGESSPLMNSSERRPPATVDRASTSHEGRTKGAEVT